MGMARDATAATIEVEVRFAGDLVEVTRVPAGSAYAIGTESLVAKAGNERTIGLVTVTMSAATAPPPVPRRRLESRPYQFGGASLAAHLALVGVALALTPPEPVTAPVIEVVTQQRGGTRIKSFSTEAQTVVKAPEPAANASPTAIEQPTEVDTPAPPMAEEFTPSEITGGGLVTEETPKDGDGTSERFDPSNNPAFDTIKSGAYSTVSTGHGAGDDYTPHARNSNLVVITCDRITCLVVGASEKAIPIRKAVEARVADLTDCYKHAAENGGGSVEIDFGIDAAGGVRNFAVGDGDSAGLCVAKILRALHVDGSALDSAASET